MACTLEPGFCEFNQRALGFFFILILKLLKYKSMIKAIKIFTTVAAITLLSSFTMPSTNDFLGTYSVPDSDPAQIQLT